jgi:hypothetical protein
VDLPRVAEDAVVGVEFGAEVGIVRMDREVSGPVPGDVEEMTCGVPDTFLLPVMNRVSACRCW